MTTLQKPRRLGRDVALLTLVAVLAVACAAPVAQAPSAEPSSAPSTAPEPIVTPDPTPVPTAAPTATSTPAPPPLAEIVTADGNIQGTLGTYSIDGRGSDAPWLPFSSLPGLSVAPGELLTIRFVDGVGIGQWQVLLAPASDTGGLATRGVDGGMLGPLADVLVVGPLPAGSWVRQARLFRADERGDGLTYWAVTVP
ncbi:MAG TPA: hypothetical protein VI687_03545 [Candidatus Limnocylindrales bacterium]|nr:hypothetical protein [Candidatus Limnocylindrales bacterium]